MSAMSSTTSSLVLLLLLILVSSVLCTTTSTGKSNHDEDQDQQHMKPPLIKSVMSLTETAFPYTSMYLEKGRVVLKKVHAHLFRPTPDVESRAKEGVTAHSDGIAASKGEEDGGGVGEKVKEAVSKSVEKSKSTIEDSAKLAGDALHEVADKVKSSFKQTQHSPHQLEL